MELVAELKRDPFHLRTAGLMRAQNEKLLTFIIGLLVKK